MNAEKEYDIIGWLYNTLCRDMGCIEKMNL